MTYGNQHGGPSDYDPRSSGYGPQPGQTQPGGYSPQSAYPQVPNAGGPVGYGAYAQGQVPPSRPTNGMAVASLVLSIVGLIFTCGLTSIPGAILGHMALKKIKITGEDGRGMAVAGLVVSYIAIALWVIAWLLMGGTILALLGLAGSTSSSSY